jgi:SAM-dependent methyltransferase
MATSVEPANYDALWTAVYGDLQRVGPVHRHMKLILRRMLARLDYESVLDVGCGAGDNLPLLCEGRRLSRLAGVDLSAEALTQARDRWDGEFHQLDVSQSPLPGKWDLVFSSLLLEHIEEDEAALRNIRLATGKYLLATTIAGNFKRYRSWETQVGHVRNYQVGELEQKLSDAGFVVDKAVYWGFPFFTPLGRLLQNRTTGKSTFGPAMRLAAEIMYRLYFLNSHRRGDLLIVLAHV